ncbi:MAG: hypothetical protein ACJA2Q_002181 [Pseudohongiellaceae bacterium]|jgi:hypothetical protein
MLELRPNCELCDKDLPSDCSDGRICTYECTFCADCVETVLDNVCPNCDGGFCELPVRPKYARREGVSLEFQMASTKRVVTEYTQNEIVTFARKVKSIDPFHR